jgi:hypothetical protein
MRVPIENGLGLFNQVSDFIKLPAASRVILMRIRVSGSQIFRLLFLRHH